MNARRWATWTWPRRRDIDTPTGINTAVGAVAIVAASVAASRIPASAPGLRCGSVAVVTGVLALWTVDPLALAAIVPTAWLLMNGFLVNTLGVLTWHGTSDVYRLLALAGAACIGLLGGAAHRTVRDLRERRQLGALAQTWSEAVIKEEKQSA